MCQYCGKAFMQKSHLQRHTATHTGERRHSCSVCSKSFIEPGDLRKHMRTHSKETLPGYRPGAGAGQLEDVKPAVLAWAGGVAGPAPALLVQQPAPRPAFPV